MNDFDAFSNIAERHVLEFAAENHLECGEKMVGWNTEFEEPINEKGLNEVEPIIINSLLQAID